MSGSVSWEQLASVVAILGTGGGMVWWFSSQLGSLRLALMQLNSGLNSVEAKTDSLSAKVDANQQEREKLYEKMEDLLVRLVTIEAQRTSGGTDVP